CPVAHPHLPSFPTRRSSDLVGRWKTLASYTWSTLTGNVFDSFSNPWGDIPARDVYLRGGALPDDHRHEVRATMQYLVTRWLTLRSEEHTSELQSLRHLVCRL